MIQAENCNTCENAHNFHEQGICKCSCHPKITCLKCNGLGYIGSKICQKCRGFGSIINILSIKTNLFT
jgi:DnaJ-class molecular chaperone